MSILTPGSKCTLCNLIDFLPFTCTLCKLIYCKEHIQSPLHKCLESTSEATTSSSSNLKPGKLNRGKIKCNLKECQNESIESLSGYIEELRSNNDIAKKINCEGCLKSFCIKHRSQISHSCSKPLIENSRYDSFLKRQLKAKEIINKQFPEFKNRIIPKPPPSKDIIKKELKSNKLPSTSSSSVVELDKLNSENTISNKIINNEISKTMIMTKTKTKTKDDKLWDINLKKLRMTSESLINKEIKIDNSLKITFFEWIIDIEQNKLNKLNFKNGKWLLENNQSNLKFNKNWINSEIPIGKLFDLLIEKGKIKRSLNKDDPAQVSFRNNHK
uniref:AN1-type domain-containing protein n=1 Tax=Kwoniella pini CBS 10737 TaxID=1296096 RepID=A0A1B9HV11_9TREE|nr:uncharacterized protein I206_06874 [Kwoniella pini CBS 10737]OCF47098.1 hypothetical protein I206_06874 [Kwoniella pini CBS 10737]